MLGKVAELAFDRVFVLCFEAGCERYRKGGGVWWPAIEDRVRPCQGSNLRSALAATVWCDALRVEPLIRGRIAPAVGGLSHHTLRLSSDLVFNPLSNGLPFRWSSSMEQIGT